MSILNTKALKGIICGLLVISIVSIACAGVGDGDSAMPAIEIQPKVGANVVSSSAYVRDCFPEFEKIKVDPAYKYLTLEPGDSKNLL